MDIGEFIEKYDDLEALFWAITWPRTVYNFLSDFMDVKKNDMFSGVDWMFRGMPYYHFFACNPAEIKTLVDIFSKFKKMCLENPEHVKEIWNYDIDNFFI